MDGMEWESVPCMADGAELGLIYEHHYGLYCLSSLLGIIDSGRVGLKRFGNSSLCLPPCGLCRLPREKGFTRISQHTSELCLLHAPDCCRAG
jgi:hypothetical protein